MTKPINTESIESATHKAWNDWIKQLDEAGGRNLSHTELAQKVQTLLDSSVGNSGWWAQSITVAYEQHIGKRIPGQLADGLFEIAVSKTTGLSRSGLFPLVVHWFGQQAELNSQEPINPRSTETPKRSTWRCDFADKSKFSATVEDNQAKAKLILAHTAIPNQVEAEHWKAYWKATIDQLSNI